MKTTMVAGVWSLQERGIHRSPPTFCLLFCGRSRPAVCRQDGCRRPPDPPLCPHPRSGRMLGWAKRLRRSCLTAETRLTRGGLRGGRRGQPQLRPPRCSVTAGGKRGPLLWPPRSPPALPPPPTHGTAAGIRPAELRGGISPIPPLAPLGPHQDPPRLLPAEHSIPVQTSCWLPWQTGRSWEAFPPVSTSPWDMALHSPRCQRSPSSAVPSVPLGTQHPPQPPSPALSVAQPQWGDVRHCGAKAVCPQGHGVQRGHVTVTRAGSTGETELSDQSNQ